MILALRQQQTAHRCVPRNLHCTLILDATTLFSAIIFKTSLNPFLPSYYIAADRYRCALLRSRHLWRTHTLTYTSYMLPVVDNTKSSDVSITSTSSMYVAFVCTNPTLDGGSQADLPTRTVCTAESHFRCRTATFYVPELLSPTPIIIQKHYHLVGHGGFWVCL